MSLYPEPGLVQTPDLTAAGGAEDTSLLQAMGGGPQAGVGPAAPPAPKAGMSSLIQALAASGGMGGTANTFGGMLANALAGGASAFLGVPNPVQAQQNTQANQQLVTNRLLLDVQREDRQAAFQNKQFQEQIRARNEAERARRETAREKFLDQVISQNTPEGNLWAWNQKRQELSGAGVPDTVIQQLANSNTDPKTIEEAIRDLHAGVPFDVIMTVRKGIRPDMMQFLQTKANDPLTLQQLGIKVRTPQEETEHTEDRAIKAQDAKNKVRALDMQEAHYGQMATIEERRAAEAATREERAQRTELRQEAAARRAEGSQSLAERRLVLSEERMDIWKKNLERTFETKEDKKQATFNVMTDTLGQMSEVSSRMDKKGFLQKTDKSILGGILTLDTDPAKAAALRQLHSKDPDLRLWGDIFQGFGVGYERSIANDIGPRALAAFKGILRFYDEPGTKQGIDQAIKFMQREIDLARSGKQPEQDVVYRQKGQTYTIKWKQGTNNIPADAEILLIDGQPPVR